MEAILVQYAKPELLILIPVLWLIGDIIKKTKLSSRFIPLIVGLIGIALAGIYMFATLEHYTAACIARGAFASITQGILCAGGSVYAHELIKNIIKKDVDK